MKPLNGTLVSFLLDQSKKDEVENAGIKYKTYTGVFENEETGEDYEREVIVINIKISPPINEEEIERIILDDQEQEKIAQAHGLKSWEEWEWDFLICPKDCLPPNEYWIGDLSVVNLDFFPENDYWFEGRGGIFESQNGDFFALLKTHGGDGVYEDQEGEPYPVDSGCIGCFPASAVSDFIDQAKDSGSFIISACELPVEYIEESGTIIYGDIEIVTKI